uniref:Ig-like domain-containing protein n=1 Tax=Cyprinodon variegatus TaxID=28743 RepID=A0A3Q2CNG9_CYPVA
YFSEDFPKPKLILMMVCFLGEKVTLRCEIYGGGGTQWTYEWRPTSRNSPTSSEYRINRVSMSDSGEYSCRNQCFTLNTVKQSLSGLQVSLSLFIQGSFCFTFLLFFNNLHCNYNAVHSIYNQLRFVRVSLTSHSGLSPSSHLPAVHQFKSKCMSIFRGCIA